MKGTLSRALVTLGHAIERTGRATIWLATAFTSLEQLRRGEMRRWSGFHATDREVDSGLMDWEAALADEYVPSGSRVLVVGCGTGRDVVALARRGCRVAGVDPVSSAVAFARRTLTSLRLEAELLVGFVEDHRWPPHFDVVWFSWFSYSYIPSPSRTQALQRATDALAPGGRIILTAYRYPPTERLSVVGRAVGRWMRNDWHVTPGDDVAVIPGTGYLSYQHLFPEGALEDECRRAGLEVIHAADRDSILVLQRSRV